MTTVDLRSITSFRRRLDHVGPTHVTARIIYTLTILFPNQNMYHHTQNCALLPPNKINLYTQHCQTGDINNGNMNKRANNVITLKSRWSYSVIFTAVI